MKRPLVAALCFALDALLAANAGVAPTEFAFVPVAGADGMVRGIDGRAWKLTNPAALAQSLTRPYAVTENHAGVLAAKNGVASPAFGWIESARLHEGQVLITVNWTERGKAALAAKDYRFFSPEFLFDPDSREITAIVGGSLTNDPNFPELALNATQVNRRSAPEGETPMSLKLIALAAGISADKAETATEAEVITAINAVKEARQVALNAAATPPLDRFVPRADHDLALNRATTAETKLADATKAQHTAAVEADIAAALTAGKITPATAEYHRAACATEAGHTAFKKFVGDAPVVGDPAKSGSGTPPGAGGSTALNAEERETCRVMGMAEADFVAQREKLKTAGRLAA